MIKITSKSKIKGKITKNKYTCNHTFVICAYQESPYLKECIESLMAQTVSSKIMMITSTPNSYIEQIAEQYQIPYYINTEKKGIANDWNYAYRMADTTYVTLAHQDDIYVKDYLKEILLGIKQSQNPLIAFTDYYELRNGTLQRNNTMLNIKRFLLLPLTCTKLHSSIFIRRRILSFGCPICCPSVTFHKSNLPEQIFIEGYRSDADWQAWEKLSRRKGDFIYIHKPLTYHRIHEESATTAIIGDRVRSKEDYEMFRCFWPPFIARLLVRMYSKSEQSNTLSKHKKEGNRVF